MINFQTPNTKPQNQFNKVIEWLFYIFIFLLPWQTRYVFRWGEMNGRWEYGDISIYGTDILLGILLVLALIRLVKCQMSNVKCQIKYQELNPNDQIPMSNDQLRFTIYDLRFTKPWLVIALFELMVFLSIFWAHDWRLALYGWLRILAGIGLFWSVLNVRFSWKKIIYAIVFSGIVQSIIGIYQFVSQSTFASKWLGMAKHVVAAPGTSVVEVLDQRWLRAYGALPHPNVLAGFLVICFLLLVGLVIVGFWGDKGFRGDKILLIVGVVTILPALFFTFSREAWLALVVSCTLYIICLLVKRKRLQVNCQMFIQVLIISAIIVGVLAFMYKDLVGARLAGTERLEVKSNVERITTYQQAKNILFDSFPLGVGVNNYSLALHERIDNSLESWGYQPVHNVFLLVLSEIGVVELVLFLLLIVYVLMSNFKCQMTNKIPTSNDQFPNKTEIRNQKCETNLKSELRVTSYGLRNHRNIILSATFIAMLTIMLFDHYFWTLSFGIYLFWLVVGLNLAKDRE